MDTHADRIRKAVRIGCRIRDLEEERYLLLERIRELEEKRGPMVEERDAQQLLINGINRQLDLLWLEIGKLKHAAGE